MSLTPLGGRGMIGGGLGRGYRKVTPWWLAGGISPANCVAAYQAKGAVSYAASKVNLANPGTYDAMDGTSAPPWDSTNGWVGNNAGYLDTRFKIKLNWSVVIRGWKVKSGNYGYLFGNFEGGYAFQYQLRSDTNRLICYYGNNYNNTYTVTPSGDNTPFIIGFRTKDIYVNGSYVGSVNANELTSEALNYTYLLNSNGGYQVNYSNLYAISFYNIKITELQMADLSAAIAAL